MKTLDQNFRDAQQLHVELTKRNDMSRIWEVFDLYAQCLNQAPDEPAILFSMGAAAKQMGWNGLAITLCKRSLEFKEIPEVWNNLGAAYKAEFMHDQAREAWQKAIELNPRCSDYYMNMSTLFINEGIPDGGIEYANKAVELAPVNMKAHWNRSLLLLEMGLWREGFAAYDAGLHTRDRTERYFDSNRALPTWKGETLTPDDEIVVYGEQGMGDEIMFASALPDLIATGAKVIYECHPRLYGVMRRSFPGLHAIYPTRKARSVEWPAEHDLTYKVAIGSLFRWFRSDGEFPQQTYLKPDPELVNEYRQWLVAAGPGPRVGIGWAGGTKHTHGMARSIKVSHLKPVLTQPGTFISLQYTPEADDKLVRFERDTGIKVHHWPEVVRESDYDHTLALLAALDVVITINTTAVHACGAIGTPCWTLTPNRCAWRYAQGDGSMVMYGDHVRQYRERASMIDAINKVADDLGTMIQLRWGMRG